MDWIKSWTADPSQKHRCEPPLEGMANAEEADGHLAERRPSQAGSVKSVSINSEASSIHHPPSFTDESTQPGPSMMLISSPQEGSSSEAAETSQSIVPSISFAQECPAITEAALEQARAIPDALAEPPQSHVGASAIYSSSANQEVEANAITQKASIESETGMAGPPGNEPVDEAVEQPRKEPPPPRKVRTLDALIDCGIGEYTFVPGKEGVLGRGKFSSVWLARRGTETASQGQFVAIKHTPLYPHPQVIAQRLLREPNLLATLQSSLHTPHPNLVKIYELIRTPGHFYLVEEYLRESISLEDFVQQQPSRQLDGQRVNRIMDQLVSALRDACHPLPARIAHRDIKPENIIINPTTLHITLLDFGLATHYSGSSAKLTTVCGSPAYHSPELVLSLARPSGEISYWGPEVDAWCIGVTMLRALSGRIYPIGEQNRSISGMLERARLSSLLIRDKSLRERITRLLVRDGIARMKNLEEDKAPTWTGSTQDSLQEVSESAADPLASSPKFAAKSTSFIPQQPTEGLDISFLPIDETIDSKDELLVNRYDRYGDQESSSAILINGSHHSAAKIVSWLKYCIRCVGIVYHVRVPDQKQADGSSSEKRASDVLLQCAWAMPDEKQPVEPVLATEYTTKRPGLQRSKSQPIHRAGTTEDLPKKIRAIKFWLLLQFDSTPVVQGPSGSESLKSPSPQHNRGVLSADDLTGRLSELGIGSTISARVDTSGIPVPTRIKIEASDPRPWPTIAAGIRAGIIRRRPGSSRRTTTVSASSSGHTTPVSAGSMAPPMTPGRHGRKSRPRPAIPPVSIPGTEYVGGLGLSEITEASPGPKATNAPIHGARTDRRRHRSSSRERPQIELSQASESSSTGTPEVRKDEPIEVTLPKLSIDTEQAKRVNLPTTPKSAKRISLHRAATAGTPTIAVDLGTHPAEMYISGMPDRHRARQGSIAGSLENWSKDSSYASSDEGSHVYQRQDSVTSLQDLAERYHQAELAASNPEDAGQLGSRHRLNIQDPNLKPGPRLWSFSLSRT